MPKHRTVGCKNLGLKAPHYYYFIAAGVTYYWVSGQQVVLIFETQGAQEEFFPS
jgi:hypothetical protein